MPLPKLGKQAKRIDRRTLQFMDYLKAALPAPPGSMGYSSKVPLPWPMMLNDILGDCVPAAAGHMVEEWTANTGKVVTPRDAAILKAYEDVGGYVKGDPSTDNGCVMLDMLNYWRQVGVANHKILAYAELPLAQSGPWERTMPAGFEYSTWLFGNVFLGIQLPISAQGQSVWSVPPGGPVDDGSPGSWGGHCVPIVGYGGTGVQVVSWGQKLNVTWNFLWAYADEAYAVLSSDWIAASGQAPNHFDLAALEADLQKITQ